MKVLLHYNAGPQWQQSLAGLSVHGLEIDCCDERDDERFYKLLPHAAVIWHLLRPLSAADIARAAALKLIQKIGVGVNTIALDAARSRDIAVCNMPGTNSRAVAEMALGLMLACLRRLPFLDRITRAGKGWKLEASLQDSLGEIGGRTVGLVGYGAIPSLLAPVLQAMGASVVYSARQPKPDVTLPFLPLDMLLRESHIVSLHIPLTDQTQRLISRERIATMRRGSILINTGRGGLVDQTALVEALRDGRIAAAGLDVFETEPVDGTEELLKLDNVAITPHIAWLTMETLSRSLDIAVENCRRLVSNQPLLNRVH